MENGLVWHRHVDHLKPQQESPSPGSPTTGQAQADGATEDEVYLPCNLLAMPQLLIPTHLLHMGDHHHLRDIILARIALSQLDMVA